MPEYLATGRRPDGRKVTENVVANSADEAVRLLAERGYDDVVLHNDDLTALFTRQREKAEHISPADYVRIRNLPRGVGVLVVVTLNGYRKTPILMASAALALACLRLAGGPWMFWDTLCVVILFLPPTVGLIAALFGPGGRALARYRQMLEALYWGRWEEALARADRVGAGRKMSSHEIPFRKAQALAGMGRLDEALALFEPFGDGKSLPPWLYRSLLAQIYEFAQQRDEAVAQLEQAVALAPGNSTVLLALARMVIWHQRDARRARALLAEARTHALSDMTRPFADMLEGAILLEEKRPRDALPIFDAAYRIFRAREHMPLGFLPVEHAMIGRALAHAALGERDEALSLYTQVRPRLAATRSEILDRCDRELGWVASAS